MSQRAHGDPEAMREFARRLNDFCDSTRERLSGVRGHLQEMGNSSWSDVRYTDYAARFEQAAAQVYAAIEQIQPDYIQELESLAQRLEEYLNG